MSRGDGRTARTGLWDLGRGDDSDDYNDPPLRFAAPQCAVLSRSDVPGTVVVPAFPVDGDGFARVQLQLLRHGDDVLAVGFSSRERLVAALGEYQPWLQLPGDEVVDLLSAGDVAGLIVDPASELVSAVWSRPALLALEETNDVRL